MQATEKTLVEVTHRNTTRPRRITQPAPLRTSWQRPSPRAAWRCSFPRPLAWPGPRSAGKGAGTERRAADDRRRCHQRASGGPSRRSDQAASADARQLFFSGPIGDQKLGFSAPRPRARRGQVHPSRQGKKSSAQTWEQNQPRTSAPVGWTTLPSSSSPPTLAAFPNRAATRSSRPSRGQPLSTAIVVRIGSPTR